MTALTSALIGDQTPRVESVPAYVSTTGQEAIELAELAGITLDPWQQHILNCALGEKANGDWSAPEIGVVLARQNGKNEILVVRELAGLFLLGERLIIHSAHQADTSMEAWRRLRFVIENTPELDARVKSYPGTHGQEGIELKDGRRIRFRTRTKGGGRGFSGDCVIFDEAMIFDQASLAAILPVVSARKNNQVWYTGSAVDQLVHDNGLVLARVRQRGHSGTDERLAYFEWSLDRATPSDVEPELLNDPTAWAQANPALGIRIAADYVAGEIVSLGPRAFAVERLGVGDWPDPDGNAQSVIDPDQWAALADEKAVMQDPVVLAFDVVPDRSSAAIGAAGVSQKNIPMVEVARHESGAAWVVPAILDMVGKHRPLQVVCDGVGAAASLIPDLEQAGVAVTVLGMKEHTSACGLLYDDVAESRLVHLGQHPLTLAIRGATKRPLGGAWAWNRKSSAVDISPLVAVTLALGGYRQATGEKPKAPARIINLNDLPD